MDKTKFENFVEKTKSFYKKFNKKLSPFCVVKIILTSPLPFFKKIFYLIPSKIFIFQERENLILEYRIKNLLKDLNHILNNKEEKKAPFFKIIKDENFEFSSNMENFSMVILKDQYLVNQFIKKNDIVIDAGANIGFFSLFAAFKEAKVFAFEPVSETYNRLLENINYFKAEKEIFPFCFALGDLKKESLIRFNPFSSDQSTIIDSGRSLTKKFVLKKVNIITIDDFVNENKIKKIDFIKIDTEGYELKILKGAKETIKKFKPKIAISAYHKKEDKKEIPDFLLKIRPDYQYKLIKRAEEIFIFF